MNEIKDIRRLVQNAMFDLGTQSPSLDLGPDGPTLEQLDELNYERGEYWENDHWYHAAQKTWRQLERVTELLEKLEAMEEAGGI